MTPAGRCDPAGFQLVRLDRAVDRVFHVEDAGPAPALAPEFSKKRPIIAKWIRLARSRSGHFVFHAEPARLLHS